MKQNCSISSTLLLGVSLILAQLALVTEATYIQYTTVTGYFLQDVNSTNATTFDYTATNFGLINQTYDTDAPVSGQTQWQRFAHKLFTLNSEAPKNVDYKLLFLGRHGEGYHNAAESFYGTPAWNCYWAELNGNTTTTWADAHLTVNGIAQAQKAHDFWASEMQNQKLRLPQTFYTSPLSRCLATANITFFGLDGSSASSCKPGSFVPTVKELLRESISIHTCDRRSNRTYIHDLFPSWKIEAGFTEFDQLWNGVTAETSTSQDVRSKTVLDEIFSSDKSTAISITSHSGEIGSILRVLGHRTFSLSTGAVIPVLVKAVTVEQQPTSTITALPWTASPHCTSPPLSSISNGACVCSGGAAPVTTTLTGTGPTITS